LDTVSTQLHEIYQTVKVFFEYFITTILHIVPLIEMSLTNYEPKVYVVKVQCTLNGFVPVTAGLMLHHHWF